MRLPKSVLAALFVAGATVFVLSICPVFAADAPLGSSVRRIEAAYDAGGISFEQAITLKVLAVRKPQELPDAYRSTLAVDGKCAAMVMVEAARSMDKLSPAGQASLAEALARPNLSSSFNSPGGHFVIHYATVGGNAVPAGDTNSNSVPDYVERVADYCDSSWRQMVDQYGYFPPPSDGGIGGGAGLYDIYCLDIPYYGYTAPEAPGPQAWNDYTSYIAVHNNFFGFPPNTDPDGPQLGAAKVTVAHELFHAVQFAYDVDESAWWMEHSSTWMEDQVYDTVNDNWNYLDGFFPYPYASLMTFNGWHEYASFIWPRYLSENHGDSVMHDIWADCISTNAVTAIDNAMVARGSSRSGAFAGFTAWNWITFSRSDGLHYSEGASYPLIAIMRTHSTYPVTAQTSLILPEPLGSNYVYFLPPGGLGDESVKFSFDGDDAYPWVAAVVARRTTNEYEIYYAPLDGSQAGSVTLGRLADYAHVALIPGNAGLSGSADYTYSACLGPNPPSLVSPADGATAGTPVALDWSDVAGAVSYRVQVDDDPGFGSPDYDTSVSVSEFTAEGLTVSQTYYWRATATNACAESGFGASRSFTASCVVLMTGDVNENGAITSADVISLVNYTFKAGAPPQPIEQAGDANCSGAVTSADIIYLVGYVFKGGPAPCDVCSIL
jgi:hypothetical protein